MFSRLQKFFKAKQSAPVARSPHSSDLIRAMADLEIFVIAAVQSDGIDPRGLTKEQLLDQIRRAAEDLSGRQSFDVFVYEFEGMRRLPFFSSDEHLQKFVGWYSTFRNRVYPFQILTVKVSSLAKFLSVCDSLVMNDRSDDEAVLSSEQVQAIPHRTLRHYETHFPPVLGSTSPFDIFKLVKGNLNFADPRH